MPDQQIALKPVSRSNVRVINASTVLLAIGRPPGILIPARPRRSPGRSGCSIFAQTRPAQPVD